MKLSHINLLACPFGGASVVGAASLDEAIRAYLLANCDGLSDCYRMETPAKVAATGLPPAPPYAIVSPLNEVPEWNNAGGPYAAWATYQITFVDTDGTQAQALRDAAYRLLAPGKPATTPLAFSDGKIPPNGSLPGMKRQIKQMKAGTNGQPLWLFSFDVRFYVTRSMT